MTGTLALALLAATAPLLPLAVSLHNRLTWPRPRPLVASRLRMGGAFRSTRGLLSVLVPARNESQNIRACVESILAQGEIVGEVLVYSDESTDDTEEQVRSLARRDSRVRLLSGERLPAGWVGKPHACERLRQTASGSWLLFLDADVRVTEGALEGLLEYLERRPGADVDVVSLVPRQLAPTFLLGVLQPLLLLTYLSWLPLEWANRQRSTRFVAACGQMLLVRRTTLDRLEGFASVRHAVVDDVEFCRHARRQGATVTFLDGHDLATCTMYAGAREFWLGFSKNVFSGLRSEQNLLIAIGLHVCCYVLPYALLAMTLLLIGAHRPPQQAHLLLAASSVGVLANWVQRALQAHHHREPLRAVILHPLAVVVLIALGLDSWRRVRSGRVEWAGRRYPGVLA